MVLVRGTGVLEDYRISLFGLIAYNLVGGAVTGAIVGSLLPFAKRNSLGAAGVGFVGMLPASIVGMLLVTPPTEWHDIVPLGRGSYQQHADDASWQHPYEPDASG